MSTLRDKLVQLCKWRAVFAGWQLGTRADTDGECRAVRDHREVTILLRAEVSALVWLMIQARVFTVEQWEDALGREADALSVDYAGRFPGFTATDEGISMDIKLARETMARLGFPP